ncbi:aminotransferase class I/II-fold pyridoxal phosphate-dependent enzyme [Salinicola aestuarinus]|uniref:aminotransferase class I/II-fold pyridoxal phosphate-dependent enzyme n=1 Tax=Salinicola aestuarinus TaxID=1949082 RepID=UPI000DA1E162|nr:aminotransferase class I/II-fold pyridoxal phosphate-dependent enzyme [Salinicola aestuarinus]
MPRFARHLENQDGPHNPFPGVSALERKLGHSLPHRIGSNEGLDMPHRALAARFGDDVVTLARAYGDAEAWAPRQRLGDTLAVAPESIVIDAGADSLMALCLRTLCDPESRVIVSAGTYPTFSYFVHAEGLRMVEVAYASDADALAPDLAALAAAARREDARAVYLANPDNPSGYLHSDADVLALRDALPEGCTLILDEAYHDFRDDAWTPAANGVWPGVIRLRTFSKAHGLAGLRIGYAIAEPETVAMMMKARIHYAVSSLALAAAITVLDHPDETREHVAAVVARREALAGLLIEHGGDVLASTTNFVALRLPSAERAAQLHAALLAEGTLIHRPAHPALGHVLRISALDDALTPGRLETLTQALRLD